MTGGGRGGPARTDTGSILILTLGFFVVAVLLVLAVTDAGAVFLARRDLAAEADAAALAAADQVDRATIYASGLSAALPVDTAGLDQAVARLVRDDLPGGCGGCTVQVASPDGVHVVVVLTRAVRLPVFGVVTVHASATALSAVAPGAVAPGG